MELQPTILISARPPKKQGWAVKLVFMGIWRKRFLGAGEAGNTKRPNVAFEKIHAASAREKLWNRNRAARSKANEQSLKSCLADAEASLVSLRVSASPRFITAFFFTAETRRRRVPRAHARTRRRAHCSPAGRSRFQSLRPVRRVAELLSLDR